jgi:sortase A
MWTARGDVMRSRNLVLVVAALAMVVVLAACSSSGQSSGDEGQAQQEKASQEKVSQEEQSKKQETPGKKEDGAKQGPAKKMTDEPEKKRFKLTVPAMKRIEDDPIPTGLGTDENLFRDYAGVHLISSGFPWKKTANVYIAGHRIGFPGTRSNMAFYDLEDLENGDKVYLEDADGRKYTYVVYKKLVVGPKDLSVIDPIEGKNIVSLQTCTLPDYTKRVIYRAKLEDIETQDTKSKDEKSKDEKSKDEKSKDAKS